MIRLASSFACFLSNSFRLVTLTVFLSLTLASTFAQQTLGGINGTVTDPSGAVVQGVQVKLTNPDTGLARITSTDADGSYRLDELPAGTYVLTLTKEGFEAERHSQIIVHATRTTTVAVKLKPGKVSETVQVNASPLLNQVDTTNGYILDAQTIEEVPLVTGSFTQLAILSPGVSADFISGNDTNAGLGNQSIWANGQRDTSNSFNINEVSANNIFSGKSSSNLSANRVVLNTGENLRNGGQIQTNTSVYDAIGQGLPTPPPETIQELQVNTSLYDVSQGATSGAHIDVRTRSGTNSLHGQAYWYHATNWLNAAPVFYKNDPTIPAQDKVPQLHRNVIGATVGGPVKRDRLFFFLSYQFTRTTDLGLGISQNLTVPPHLTAAVNRQDPAQLEAVASADYGVTVNQIDPAAMKLLNFKLPNGQFLIPSTTSGDPNISIASLNAGGADVFLQGNPLFRADQFNTNLDYNVNDHDVLSGKYYFQRDPNSSPFASSDVAGFPQQLQAGSQVFSLANNMNLGPRTTWEQKVGFVRQSAFGNSSQPLTPADVGINLFGANRFPAILIFDPHGSNSGGHSLNIGPNGGFTDQGVFQNLFEASSNLSRVVGRHTFSLGANWDYTQLNIINHANQIATINVNDFPSFLEGQLNIGRSFLLDGASNRYYRAKQVGAYAQDKVRVSRSLVVTAGLRFDYDGPLVEKYGNLFNFDSSKYQYNLSTDTIVNSGLVIAGNNKQFRTPGTSNSTLRGNQYGFAPRIGIAWSPRNNFVVRTGFGLYFDRGEFFSELSPGAGQDISGPFGVTQEPPLVQKIGPPPGATLSNPFGTTLPSVTGCTPVTFTSCLPNMAALIGGAAPAPFGAYDPANKLPYTENWTLDLQYQPFNTLVLTAGYVGNRGLHEVLPIPLNQPEIATASHPVNGQTSSYGWNVGAGEPIFTFDNGNVDLRVPFIGYSPSSVSYRAIGISTYNALQFSATKRLSHGFQLGAAYTWSHSLDEQSGLGLFFNGNNALFPRTGYASSDYDRTHVFTLNFVYQMPNFAHGSGFARKVVNGWGFRGLTVLQSGQPFSIVDFSGAVASVYYSGNDFITNPILPLAPGFTSSKALTGASGVNPNAPAINPAAFTIPLIQPGQMGVPLDDPFETNFGTGGRNVFRQAFQKRADLSLVKETKFRERYDLMYSFDIFNLTNSPSYDTPNNDVMLNPTSSNPPSFAQPATCGPSCGQLGVVQHLIGSPRLISMALHLTF